MQEHSRREFLSHSAAAAGMLALGGQSLFAQQAAAAAKPARHDHRPLDRQRPGRPPRN